MFSRSSTRFSALRFFKTRPDWPRNRLLRQQFSTSAPAAASNRLGRTLYRQLLRWAHETDDDIPLSNILPPVTLKPPEAVSAEALRKLTSCKDGADDPISTRIRDMLPPKSQVEAHRMVVPIHRASQVGMLFRAVFRMNQFDDTEDVSKQRISLAFEALKSLNELTQGLDHMKAQREKHLNREGVAFRIGQVVQHKRERWRGVVAGWQRLGLTSLTTKPYDNERDNGPEETSDANVQYEILLDSGDASLLGGRRPGYDATAMPTARQTDLELVKDKDLLRIRSSWVQHHFECFDPVQRLFIPNETRVFEYPLDVEGLQEANPDDAITVRRNKLGEGLVSGIQEFAARLERCISVESRGYSLLAKIHTRLEELANGDVLSSKERLSSRELSPFDLAVLHLRTLLNFSMELGEMMWARKIADENRERIRFKLGDIVKHTKYGFRGVIVAWDPTPTVDVSRWDGLQGIENASELPFYHVIPDQNDCIEAFGGERPFRYVCEANLEACPRHRTILNVDLDPEWEMNHAEARYTPPDDLKFKYAEDLGDNEATLSCFKWIMAELTRLQLAVIDPSSEQEREMSSIAERLSIDNLLELLKLSDSMIAGAVFEETIKELWKVHRKPDLRHKLEIGISELLHGKKEKALVTFNELVAEDPTYAEAWNKVSTCQFMLGNMQSALEAAERTLILEPTHFQALNGLGLVQYETRRYRLAVDSFRRSLTIDPWSPVSSRLAACLDLVFDNMEETGEDDDEGAQEGTAPYQAKPR